MLNVFIGGPVFRPNTLSNLSNSWTRPRINTVPMHHQQRPHAAAGKRARERDMREYTSICTAMAFSIFAVKIYNIFIKCPLTVRNATVHVKKQAKYQVFCLIINQYCILVTVFVEN